MCRWFGGEGEGFGGIGRCVALKVFEFRQVDGFVAFNGRCSWNAGRIVWK